MKSKYIYIIGIIFCIVILCSVGLRSKPTENPSDSENTNDFFIKISDRCRKTGIDFTEKNLLTLENLLPKNQNNYKTYDHKYFVLGYADKHKQAAWVSWLLTKQNVINKVTKRLDNFREDSSLTCCSSTLEDYKRSGYARGHLCPSADMLWNVNANSETFLLSNISPQVKEFNDGRWNELEMACRTWAVKNDSILIITGPILNNPKEYIGKNKVSVPDKYYKIVIDISFPKCKAVAFIMPNERLNERIFNYAATIKDVEKQTNLNFFPKYNNNKLIQSLESMCDTNMWK